MSINKSKSKLPRKVEKWSDVIAKLNLDISKPVNYVTANRIKQITNEEPRLMAKMDREENLPTIFRNNNLFLLPVSRREYAIVRGSGYHQLESITEKPTIHYTQKPFPELFAKYESEQVYLDYAYSTGLFERFAQIPLPNPPSQIRINTPKFDFDVSNFKIHVDRAQIEIDAITKGLQTTVIIEAKMGMPSSFSIRQIYYPFRTFFDQKKKNVRSFLFCVEPKEGLYLLWEYAFDPHNSFESIKLIQSKKYQIKVSSVPSIKEFRDVSITKGIEIPQADDINKIVQFPAKVLEGYDTIRKMKDELGLVIRQIDYYRQASETLGLIKKQTDKYELTDVAQRYLRLPTERKSVFICKLLLEFPVMNEIFIDISTDHNKVITKQDIVRLLKEKSALTGSTLERRARTIRSWFRWIRNNLGIVEVDKDGNIMVSRQMKLG